MAQAYNKLVTQVRKNVNYRIGNDTSGGKNSNVLNSKLLNNLKLISQDYENKNSNKIP